MVKKEKILKLGDVKDSWVYVGTDKGLNIFAKAYGVRKGKSSLTKQWEETMDFAASQNAHLGSDAELHLFQVNVINKGLLKGAFDTSGSDPAGWVWGARRFPVYPNDFARVQRLSDGYPDWYWKGYQVSVLLFRSERPPVCRR